MRDTENINISRHCIGGLFVTMNMRKASQTGGNEILHLGEMLNSECTAYKRTCIEDFLNPEDVDANKQKIKNKSKNM